MHVETGVDSLEYCPAKQDVYPRVQDLVPGCEAYPQQQVSDLEPTTGQHSLCDKDLLFKEDGGQECWKDEVRWDGKRGSQTVAGEK